MVATTWLSAAGVALAAFFASKVEKSAAVMLLPAVLWAVYMSAGSAAICKENAEPGSCCGGSANK